MDDGERKNHPSIPPNYVSLAQLQERWLLKKQQEENQNQKAVKEKDGVDTQIVGSEKTKKKIKNKKNYYKNSRSAKKEINSEKFDGEIEKNRFKGSEIIPPKKSKEGTFIGETSVGGGIYSEEVLPGNGVGNGVEGEVPNVKTVRFRGGFRGRNAYNRGDSGANNKEYRVKPQGLKDSEAKMGLEKKKELDNNERRWSGGKLQGLKGNEVELNSKTKANDEIIEVCSKIDGLKGIGRDGFSGKNHRVEGNELNDDTTKSPRRNEVAVVENAKNGEIGNEFRGYRNTRTNVGRNSGRFRQGMDRKYATSGRFGDQKVKQRDSGSGMVWVKKEEKLGDNLAEIGSSGISRDQE
ncbi:hypothetical protein ACJIZ3_013582 [Penstemon smallii]|uniref:Uncharacterized protein n=1 Tax=Penstemon smallii TaxID=265156 RepID=A0ABD3RH83_9LAMI